MKKKEVYSVIKLLNSFNVDKAPRTKYVAIATSRSICVLSPLKMASPTAGKPAAAYWLIFAGA